MNWEVVSWIAAVVAVLFVVALLALKTWSFIWGPCAVEVAQMPGWCMLIR